MLPTVLFYYFDHFLVELHSWVKENSLNFDFLLKLGLKFCLSETIANYSFYNIKANYLFYNIKAYYSFYNIKANNSFYNIKANFLFFNIKANSSFYNIKATHDLQMTCTWYTVIKSWKVLQQHSNGTKEAKK